MQINTNSIEIISSASDGFSHLAYRRVSAASLKEFAGDGVRSGIKIVFLQPTF